MSKIKNAYWPLYELVSDYYGNHDKAKYPNMRFSESEIWDAVAIYLAQVDFDYQNPTEKERHDIRDLVLFRRMPFMRV